MNFSFFAVALMLFLHGSLYYFRESEDVQEALDAAAEEDEKKRSQGGEAGAAGAVHRGPIKDAARGDGGFDAPVPTDAADEVVVKPATGIEPMEIHSVAMPARHAEVPSSSELGCLQRVRRWWHRLVPTRKHDVVWIVLLTIGYTIGVAIILGRPADEVSAIATGEHLPPL